jgi:pimeloyl-ACP methyl ester carboxylesterase
MQVTLGTGIRVAYNLDGDAGAPVLVMLGGPHSAELMRGFVGPLFTRAGVRLLTVEYRGVPPSDVPPGDYTVDELAADVASLLEVAGLAPCLLFGYSLGSLVSMQLLQDRPELVARAVLGGTRTRASLAYREMHEEFLERAARGLPFPPAAETVMRALMMFGPRRLASDPFVDTIGRVLALPPTEGYSATGLTYASVAYQPDPAALARIAVPCRVLGFEHDVLTPPDRAREVAELIPGCDYREIPRTGHGSFIERPQELTRLVLEFLLPGGAGGRAPAGVAAPAAGDRP